MGINFDVNNGDKILLTQENNDGKVTVTRADKKGNIDYEYDISAGDFIMLLNLYRYVKDNDIRHDFINPNGNNKL